MAADLRNEGIDVQTLPGAYGSFVVTVDDEPVVDGGSLAFPGILPSLASIRERVLAAIGNRKETSGGRGQDAECC